MQESRKSKKFKNKKNKITTFTIPFDLGDTQTKINTSNNQNVQINIKKIIAKAFSLHSQGKLLEAEKLIRKAITIHPDSVESYINLGIILKDLGKPYDAEQSIRKAIQLKPNLPLAHNNLGTVLKDLGKLNDAEESIRKAIQLNPHYSVAFCNLGSILRDRCNLKEAEISVRKSIELNPKFVLAHTTLGSILKDSFKHKEAEESLKTAIKINPNFAEAHNILGHLYLKQQRFEKGWKECEWRWEKKSLNIGKKLDTKRPEWRPGCKGRLLLWPEQGLGDEVLFCSLIPDLLNQIDNLILQIDKRLIPLFKRTFGDKIIYFERGIKIDPKHYDYHISMASLPKFLRNSLYSFNTSKQLKLKINEEKSNQLRLDLKGKSNKKIIGITWKSLNSVVIDKSLTLEQLILGIFSPNLCFVCLQYGDVDHEINFIKSKYNITIHQRKDIDVFNNLDDLCSLIKACDEVVSIGNITVNLCGAIGMECKTLVSGYYPWRYGEDHKYCYWFPSLKIFRSKQSIGLLNHLPKVKDEIIKE